MIARNFHIIYHVYLAIFLAVFYFAPQLSALLIVLGLLLTVIFFSIGQMKFLWNRNFIYPVLLYIGYLVGIFFTDHPEIAKGYAENKLSFVVFPLLFSFRPNFNLKIGALLVGSAVGIVLSAIPGLISALSCYSDQGTITACFTSVMISPLHHPTYFATFILITVFGCWWGWKRNEWLLDLRWIIPFTVYAAVYFLLCLSLAAFLILFILLVILGLYWIRKRLNKFTFWALTLLSPLVIVFVLIATPFFRKDMLLTVHSVSSYLTNPVGYVKDKPGDKTGNEVRLVMWTVTTLEIMDHPFGVGTGNVDDHLSSRLQSLNQKELAKMDEKHSIRYNPHNQFLQTGLELGIAGSLILVFLIGSALVIAHRSRSHLFMVILYSLIVNCIFESMLQRQSGLIFFIFWICLMTVYTYQSNTKLKSNE